jgi:neutral trehalase
VERHQWQIRNWPFFTYLSATSTQHVTARQVAWAMKDEYPASGFSGWWLVPHDPLYGHIYDHFSVVYERKNASLLRQLPAAAEHGWDVSDRIWVRRHLHIDATAASASHARRQTAE